MFCFGHNSNLIWFLLGSRFRSGLGFGSLTVDLGDGLVEICVCRSCMGRSE